MTLSCNSVPPLDLAFTFNSRRKPPGAEIALTCPHAHLYTKRLNTLTSGETGDSSMCDKNKFSRTSLRLFFLTALFCPSLSVVAPPVWNSDPDGSVQKTKLRTTVGSPDETYTENNAAVISSLIYRAHEQN